MLSRLKGPSSYQNPIIWAWVALVVVLASLWVGASRPLPAFHPQLSFEVGEPSPLKTEMTLQGLQSEGACELVVTQLAGSIRAACPQCRVLSRGCIEQTAEDTKTELAQLFAGAPQASVVGHFPGGLVRYQGASDEIALKACELAAKGRAKAPVQCFAANATRPATVLLAATPAAAGWQAADTYGLLTGLAFVLLLLQLARTPLQLLGARLITLPTWGKQITLMGFDLFMVVATLALALVIRLEGSLMLPLADLWLVFLFSPLVCLPIFYAFGLYKAVMRFIGLAAIAAIAKAVLVAAAMSTLLVYLLQVEGVPRSVPVIQGLLMMIGLGASRALARFWLSSNEQARGTRRQVMIYGAGSAGVQLAAALAHSAEFRPVAMVDDAQSMHARLVAGLKVYAPSQLALAIGRHEVAEIFLAMPSASVSRRKAIIEELSHLPVKVRTLPGVAGLAEGKVRVSDLRDVQIEDLLGRDPVAANPDLLSSTIAGKVVMVTGAGGSIGSELCRQILIQKPTHLVLLEVSEFALYRIHEELLGRLEAGAWAGKGGVPEGGQALGLGRPNITAALGSVVDSNQMQSLIAQYGVQTIFHAAAYKHVPIVEDNICAGAMNNVLGTWRLANAAKSAGVETFLLISTDKAVRPTNVMGATKRFAELCLQALAQSGSAQATQFAMVRFGNVLGSSGSVIPKFRAQIAAGGPVTVTDPRVIRYFMTISEATELVVQAAAMSHMRSGGGNGGERGGERVPEDADVFLLDMGEPVKILDLAQQMIQLSGFTLKDDANPNGDIEIAFTGLRPGEKLYEELLIGEDSQPTAHPRILRATEHSLPLELLEELVGGLETACEQQNEAEVLRLIGEGVREYKAARAEG